MKVRGSHVEKASWFAVLTCVHVVGVVGKQQMGCVVLYVVEARSRYGPTARFLRGVMLIVWAYVNVCVCESGREQGVYMYCSRVVRNRQPTWARFASRVVVVRQLVIAVDEWYIPGGWVGGLQSNGEFGESKQRATGNPLLLERDERVSGNDEPATKEE